MFSAGCGVMGPCKLAARGVLKAVTAMFNGLGHGDGCAPLETPNIDDADALREYALEMQRRLDKEQEAEPTGGIDVVDATDVGWIYDQGNN